MELPKGLKIVIRELPLTGATATALLPQQRIEQQFIMPIVLLWVRCSS